MEKFSEIPRRELRARVKEEMNWGPQSEMIQEGRPKSFQTWSRYFLAAISDVMVLWHGIRRTIFDKRSTHTMTELNPLEEGRSVMKSQDMICQKF